MNFQNVITIDGPAGSGKSTAARKVAARLGWTYCDTGAMYRAVTWVCLTKHVDFHNHVAVAAVAKNLALQFYGTRVHVESQDVTESIRSLEVNKHVSDVAAIPAVRAALVMLQQQYAHQGHVVMEGRDTGTVVAPQARYKFYFDAHLEERTKRRLAEYHSQGMTVCPEDLKKQIGERDRRDVQREHGPLLIPEGAVVIDTTQLSIDEVVDKIVQCVQKG